MKLPLRIRRSLTAGTDLRQRRYVRASRHRSYIAVPLTAIAILASACGHSSNRPTTTNSTYAQVQAQIDKSVQSIQWPPGLRPTGAQLMKPQSKTALFQAGYSDTLVHIANQCAWYINWDRAAKTHDTAGEAVALDQIVKVVPSLDSPSDASGQEFATQAASKAQVGDGSGVEDYIQANGCMTYLGVPAY
jgi:hypothetical protein